MSEEASEPNKSVEKKKGKGKLVGIMVALALILGAGAAGAVLVRLGDTVLRTSTAGPAAIAVVSTGLGRW